MSTKTITVNEMEEIPVQKPIAKIPKSLGIRTIKQKREAFKEFVMVNKTREFWIFTHDNPDPDALASAVGVKTLLEMLGVTDIELFYCGEIDFRNCAMQNVLKIPIKPWSNKNSDTVGPEKPVIIYVDCSNSQQTNVSIPFEPDVSIDHHKTTASKNVLFIHEETGACSTIVTDLIFSLIDQDQLENCFDPEQNEKVSILATALAIGIKTDTQDFTQEQTCESDHEAYKFLIKLIDKDKFKKVISYELPLYVFDSMTVAWKAKSSKSPNFITGLGFLEDNRRGCISFLADFFMRLPGIQTVMVYAIIENHIVCSGRTDSSAFDEQSIVNSVFGNDAGGGKDGMFGAKSQLSLFNTDDMDDEEKNKLWDLVKITVEKRFQQFTEK